MYHEQMSKLDELYTDGLLHEVEYLQSVLSLTKDRLIKVRREAERNIREASDTLSKLESGAHVANVGGLL